MNDITKIKVDGEPESSYQLYPRNEEFAKRAGGNTGSQSGGGGSVPKPLTYDYMPEGYPSKSVLFDIEWDGDTSGLVSVYDSYYKVANYTAVTKADLVGCMVSLQNSPEHPRPFAVQESDINNSINPHITMISDYVLFVSEPTSFSHVNFTEAGIYFVKIGEQYTASLSKQTITLIAEEFLPATAKNTTVFHSDFGPLKHDDGTLATAQEAYDAFMNTRVLIMEKDRIYEALSMLWYDNNSAQDDPANVGYVQLSYVVKDFDGAITFVTGEAGNSSLVPA